MTKNKENTIKLILQYLAKTNVFTKGYRLILAVLLILTGIQVSLQLLNPYLTKLIFDDVIPDKNISLLIILTTTFLGLTILFRVTDILSHYLRFKARERMMLDLQISLYRRMAHMPIDYLNRRQLGDVMSVVQNDVQAIWSLVNIAYNSLPIQIIRIVSTNVLIFLRNFKLGLIGVVLQPFYFIGNILYKDKMIESGRLSGKKRGEFWGQMGEGLTGILTLKCFNRVNFQVQKLRQKGFEHIYAKRKSLWISEKSGEIAAFVTYIGSKAAILYGGLEVINGNMTIGDVIAINLWLQLIYAPLNGLFNTINGVQEGFGTIERVMTVLNTKTEEEIRERHLTLPKMITGSISFRNVSFAYDESHTVLDNLTFDIDSGEVVAIVGSSGSGKTTIVKLLLGLYTPDSGSIHIDGIDISDVKLESLRDKIGIVSQDAFMFNMSVRENIQLGKLNATDEEIIKCAKAAQVDTFIHMLSEGYETVIGERGATISGGQKQRVAIARVLLKNPSILILDEAMSSVDAETEAAIQEALPFIIKGRTAIIISHRLSTLRQVERVLVLHNGNIVESGTHEELLRKQGQYYKLFETQYLIGDNS